MSTWFGRFDEHGDWGRMCGGWGVPVGVSLWRPSPVRLAPRAPPQQKVAAVTRSLKTVGNTPLHYTTATTTNFPISTYAAAIPSQDIISIPSAVAIALTGSYGYYYRIGEGAGG